ncbi:MAG: hypothetical protein GF409_02500, partial [Candidatus Omnitrophica bacterium]|nr:hypothetical protein [Candidatus Omnitrophota bacterium]
MQNNHRKRIWLKVISFFVAFVFLFQQLGIADSTGYKRLGGVAEELLPSSGEYEQANRFAPGYLKRQQSKHEDIVRQRMGKEELMIQLQRKPKKEEEDLPLKKKRGGGGAGGSIDYTMTEPDDLEDPHLYNDLDYEDSALTQIDTYDITRHPDIITDIDGWKATAEEQEDEKTKLKYWAGYGDEAENEKNRPHESRRIKQVVYFGDESEEKIETVLTGYVRDPGYDPLDKDDEEYKAKYKTEYEYDGDDISSTKKYYIWGGVKILLEESVFEGKDENNKIVRRINYDKLNGDITSRQDFIYEGSGDSRHLVEQRSYDTKNVGAGEDPAEEGVGELTSCTYFLGSKDKEIADYTVNMKDGKITTTIINYYEGSLRASGLTGQEYGYREPKEKVVTYRGEVDPSASDADGDGLLDGYEDKLTSIAYYDTTNRLPGEEVLDYTESYARGKVIQTTIYWYYHWDDENNNGDIDPGEETEVRAANANYRACMTKSITYWGDDISADNIKSITYYYIEGRLKGEETADYTIRKNTRGDTVSTMFYYYEGSDRASESEALDRMSKNVTYRGEVDPNAVDSDGDGILDGYEDQLASITYFDWESREKGKEVSDYTLKYNTRQQVINTTVYLYESELNRAEDAGSDDRMDRSVTYRGEVDVDAGDADGDGLLDGYEDKLESITYYDYETRLKGEEVSDYTEKYNSNQEVTSTTVYLYESDLKRAEEADSYDRMSRSVTYRGEVDATASDSDSDGLLDGYEDQLASITYYDFEDRVKGEEISDYTEKYNSRQQITNTTVYYYEDDLRATEAGSSDRMSRSVTYRGEVDTDALDSDGDGLLDGYEDKLASITYYDYESRLKGEEVTDYTEKYNSNQQITATTIYLYEADLKRAADADSYDRMSRNVTYRGEVDPNAADSDGDGILDGYEDQLASITYFDYEDRLKGEEISDYTEKFNSNQDVINTTIYYYEDNKRAEDAGASDRMSKSVTYRGEVDPETGDLDGDGILDGYEDQLASITYYDYEDRLKGEEVSDYTEKYNSNQEITGTTVYLYEADLKRAEDADSSDRMSRSVTYRGEVDTSAPDTDGDGILDGYEDQLASITYYDYEDRLKGEEVTDYTEKYNSSQEVTNTTVYLYEDQLKRASEAGADDRMARSVTYRGELADPQGADSDGDGIIDAYSDKLSSITYYDYDTRLKGEEITDYTEKFNSAQEVTTTTVYLYEADLNRAADAASDDRMARSVTYRGELADPQSADSYGDGIIDAYSDEIASITYYDYDTRLKGEEVTDYTEKYNSNQEITNTTVYLYESDLDRATGAASDDRMARSVTYRGELADPQGDDLDGNGVIDAYEDKLASVTYYDYDGRLKGEEITDYTEKYNSEQEVTTTTVYLYEADLDRASDANADDRMARSVSYRGELADPQSADNNDDGIIDAYSTDLASITYYDYDGRLKGEEITDYTEKYNTKQEVTNTTVYLYESDLKRADAASSDDRMARSVTYRGALADPDSADSDGDGVMDAYASDLASITYYDYVSRLKGEEITDYTEKYNSDQEVTATTIYIYEADLERASASGADDRMARSVTYRGGLANPQSADTNGDGIIEAYQDKLASITFYDYVSRLKGEEITDYTEKYNSDQDVTATTVYLYESGLKRASASSSDDRMARSVTYRGELADPQAADTDGDGVIGDYSTKLSSVTYYDFDTRLKGEEITDYTKKYNSKQEVTNTTVYLYEADLKRADAASSDDRMSRSVTYRRDLADPHAADVDGDGIIGDYSTQLASITYYDFATRFKGEEITDYTEKYNSEQDVTNTTVYLYEADLKRASATGPNDRMSRNVSYRGELADPQGADADSNGLIDDYEEDLASITYFDFEDRLKGEEISDYTEKYNSKQEITATTVYLYEAALKRASDAGADDRMSRSVTYRKELQFPQAGDIDNNGLIDIFEDRVSNITYYDYATRIKGEEVTDYSESYNNKQALVQTSVYLYESDLKRAEDAGASDRMSRTVAYHGGIDPMLADGDADGVIDDEKEKLASITYYDFESRLKGEEILDYIERYGINNIITGTTVYLYEDEKKRAAQAKADDRIAMTSSYRGEINTSGTDSDSDGVIDDADGNGADENGVGMLNGITYYRFNNRIKGEEVIDYNESFNRNRNLMQTTVYYYGDYTTRPDDSTNLLVGDRLVKTASFNRQDKLVSASIYTGDKGEEQVTHMYGYHYRPDTDESDAVSRTDYYYHDDNRTQKTMMYDIKNKPLGDTTLLTRETVYNYRTENEHVIDNVVAVGTQYFEQDPSKITGINTTVTEYGDYGTQTSSVTVGTGYKYYGMPNERITSKYTTRSEFDDFGVSTEQITTGVSYAYIDKDGNGTLESKEISSMYTTSSKMSALSGIGGGVTQIDEYGIVRETVTVGINGQDYDQAAGKFNILKGKYTTTATNNVYGTLIDQTTTGESYNRIWDGSEYVRYKVGTYTTKATSIDAFGIVGSSTTVGESFRMDKDGSDMRTGMYTTTVVNNEYGTLQSQETVGKSFNKIWNGSEYILYDVGAYTTEATDIDGWGTVKETTTVGANYKLESDGITRIRTGAYTTVAKNNDFGTLQEQQTVGESYNKIWNGSDYVLYTVGTYTTDATDIDGYGTVLETTTYGESVRLDHTGSEIITGAYTTVAHNNEYGTLKDQTTVGESYAKGDKSKVTGGYTTEATDIDGFGTVLETITAGVSYVKGDKTKISGGYTTTAHNDIYGILQDQVTVGVSYAKGDKAKISGAYTTTATSIDGFGTVKETVTYGESYAKGDRTKISGAYTTRAQNNDYGTLEAQATVGVSYAKGDKSKVSGGYTTTAVDVDGFGTVRKNVTIGESYAKGDKTKISGAYTTTAENDVYGFLSSQTTVGVSYAKGDKDKISGGYTTTATVDSEWGTVEATETVGVSYAKGDKTKI